MSFVCWKIPKHREFRADNGPKASDQDNGESCTMKENKYDDLLFFQKYSQMECSKSGLAGAGEWNELEKLLPDFSG